MLPENIEPKLISEIKYKFHDELRSIVLFGSYASGTAQKYSDILNILNSGIPLLDDGSFNNLKDNFRYIVRGKVVPGAEN